MIEDSAPVRPDVVAAIRGGDADQGMEEERDFAGASLEEAMFWRRTYSEIVTMEEAVMARVRELMAKQSVVARREVELSNVPVIAGQLERFRSRLKGWDDRLRELERDGQPLRASLR
jgi:hypothetical protein